MNPTPVDAERLRQRLLALTVIAIVALLTGSVLLIWQPGEPGPVSSFEVVSTVSDGGRAGDGDSGPQYLRTEEVIAFSGLERGVSYTPAELAAAEQRLELHPAVRAARLSFERGGVLRLELDERVCVALVRNEEASGDGQQARLFEVDRDLVILAENRVRCGDVPMIRGAFVRDPDSEDRFRDPVLERLVAGLERLRREAPELAARISELHLRRAGGLTLYLTPARVRVEMPAELDEVSLKRLYAAVAYLESGEHKSGVIDLRGPGVVILPEE